MTFKKVLAFLVFLTVSSFCFGQTATSGAITGTVTDSTGAVLPNAVVTLKSSEGATITVKANSAGKFSAELLKPGTYAVTATLDAFKSNTVNVAVTLGSTTQDNIKMVPAGATASVDVNAAEIPLIDTQNIALITTLNQEQVQYLPAPGGDVTTVAFTLPGVVVNTGGEYGNFSSDGLPGVSNLFVLNGFDNQDPFLNLNNSGSSNLTLGQGELSEVSVVQNGYNSQFGRAAGAAIFYTTKSGTNSFHGMADYYGNTSVMNANSWFGNYYKAPRPHAVSNEWAANIGGPIIKDKVFFFADYEGLRYVLPGSSGLTNFPTAALQSYVLSTVPAGALSLYKQAFAAYDSAPGYANAVAATTGPGPQQDGSGALGCGDLAGTPTGTGGTFGVDTPCVSTAFSSANNINKEWLFTGRADWQLSSTQHIYARYKVDHGTQPTSTSSINPLFSTVSIQPEDEGQLNHTIEITPNMTNSFTMAANWYSAYFGPSNPAASSAVYPDFLLPDLGYDGSGTNTSGGLSAIGVPYYLTQGRDVTQYQFVDDFTYLYKKHAFKAGFNFRRDLVSDYDQQVETVYPEVAFFTLADYTPGQITTSSPFYTYDQFDQAFSSLAHAHLALYNLGVYVQDEFQALPKLKLTFGVRIDRTGDPLCNDHCFSQYKGPFPAAISASDTTGGLTSPYDVTAGGPISESNPHPFPSVQPVNFQARFGFNYSPEPKTEIRGGIGMFSDLYPAGFLDGAIENFPNYNPVSVTAPGVYGAGTSGTLRGDAAAANTTLQAGFTSGGTPTTINTSLSAEGVPFYPPSIGAYFPSEFKVPMYTEYSLQVQHQFTKYDALIVTYAGNYGYNGVLINPDENAGTGYYTGGAWVSNGTFAGIPSTPPDARFSRVTAYTNAGHSNYNGLQTTYKRQGKGFTGEVSYTYSHCLDMVSNGGSGEPFTGASVTTQMTPNLASKNLNYSNCDYDVRSNVAGDLVYKEPKFFSNKYVDAVGGGWTVGLKSYYHSGTPFTVANGIDLGAFTNLGGTLTPIINPNAVSLLDTCSKGKASVSTPCLDANNFLGWSENGLNTSSITETAHQTDFGTVRRNAFRGPHYADTDLLVTKQIAKVKGVALEIGGNAYNVFNHPNFAAPNSTLGSAGFGTVTGTVAAPTSPYGSFQGAAVTQRIVQVHGKITF